MAATNLDASAPAFLSLLQECPIVANSTVSKPILSLPEGKAVMFSMDKGQEMSEHRAPFVATVLLLDGRLRFGVGASGKDEREISTGDCVILPANAPHRLTALEPTRFLLTLFKRS